MAKKKKKAEKRSSDYNSPDYFYEGPPTLKGETLTFEFDGEARTSGEYRQLTIKEKPHDSITELNIEPLENRKYGSVWLGHFTEERAYGRRITENGSSGLKDSCERKQIFRVKKVTLEVEVISSELSIQEHSGLGQKSSKGSQF